MGREDNPANRPTNRGVTRACGAPDGEPQGARRKSEDAEAFDKAAAILRAKGSTVQDALDAARKHQKPEGGP